MEENKVVKLFNRNFILISVASLFMFTAFYMLMPIIAMYIIDEFHADASIAGVITSAYIITALLVRPFSGYLVDRFDRRKFYIVMLFIFTLMLCGYVLSDSLTDLLITRILLGGSFALVTTAANTLAIDVSPSDKRAVAIGYYGAIIVLSMAIGPMLGLYLINISSYTDLFMISILCSFCGFILTPFIKTRHREREPHIPLSWDRFFVKEGFALAGVVGLMYFFYGSIMVYVSLYIRECNLNFNSATFFMLFAFGIIISRLGMGMLLRKSEQHTLLMLGTIVIIISGTLFTLLLNNSSFIAVSLLLGMGFGIVGPAVQSMIVELVPASRRGTANSTYFTALDMGSGLGMLVGGSIASLWGYHGLYGVGVGLSILALILYLLCVRKRYSQRS